MISLLGSIVIPRIDEKRIHAHIVSLFDKLKTSAKDTDDSSIGLDRDRVRRH